MRFLEEVEQDMSLGVESGSGRWWSMSLWCSIRFWEEVEHVLGCSIRWNNDPSPPPVEQVSSRLF